jgi:heme/copper-type cytochrome/quinol oxidase subunit 2
MPGRSQVLPIAICVCSLLLGVRAWGQAEPRVIEILADKDSRYKIDGVENPTLVLKAGSEVKLRITARKAKSWNRDGSVHGFAMIRAKDGAKVEGWNLLLRSGTQEIVLSVPSDPGEYRIVCTVICSDQHDGMQMKVIVIT